MADRALTDAVVAVIRGRMDEQNISGRTLAERAVIPVNTLARNLRGEGDLSLEQLDAIAVVLGSNRLEELLEDARLRL